MPTAVETEYDPAEDLLAGYKTWARAQAACDYLQDIIAGDKPPFILEIPGVPAVDGQVTRVALDLANLPKEALDLMLEALRDQFSKDYYSAVQQIHSASRAMLAMMGNAEAAK